MKKTRKRVKHAKRKTVAQRMSIVKWEAFNRGVMQGIDQANIGRAAEIRCLEIKLGTEDVRRKSMQQIMETGASVAGSLCHLVTDMTAAFRAYERTLP